MSSVFYLFQDTLKFFKVLRGWGKMRPLGVYGGFGDALSEGAADSETLA